MLLTVRLDPGPDRHLEDELAGARLAQRTIAEEATVGHQRDGGAARRGQAERDGAAVDAALGALRKAAQGEDNVLYPMKDALRARATVGEVCNALREVWGTYVPSDAF